MPYSAFQARSGADDNFHELPLAADIQYAADELLIYDASAGLYRKTSVQSILCLYQGINTIRYVYKNAQTITVNPNGQAVSSDGLRFYTVSAATDVSLATDLATGQTEAANTKYFLWAGEINGNLGFKFSNSNAAAPGELAHPVLCVGMVKNGAASDIIPFVITKNDKYYYDVAIDVAGADVTEVCDVSVSTTAVVVDCMPFLPTGNLEVELTISLVTATTLSAQYEGAALWRKVKTFAAAEVLPVYRTCVGANGTFSIKNAAASVTRISVVAFSLK